MSTNVLSEGWALVVLYFLRIGFLYLNTCYHLQTLTKNIHTVLGIRLLTLHDGRLSFTTSWELKGCYYIAPYRPSTVFLSSTKHFPADSVPIGCLLINPTEKDWLFPH